MRKLFAIALMVIALSIPTLAGDTGTPPKCSGENCPPLCAENCGSSLGNSLKLLLIETVLTIIKK